MRGDIRVINPANRRFGVVGIVVCEWTSPLGVEMVTVAPDLPVRGAFYCPRADVEVTMP